MENINDLCATPDALRDYEWERKFLDAFVQARVELVKDEPIQGPDGWPYFFLKTQLEEDQKGEPVLKLLDWLKDKGIGLAVNTHKELPDYIFNYGMIWNFAERKLLVQDLPQQEALAEQVEFSKGEKILFGEPSEEFLPYYVRNVLMDFLTQQGVENPRVAIVGKNNDQYDLCFSLESLGNPPETEHKGILEAIAWFFPTHYSLMLLSEESTAAFYSLKN